MVSWANCLSCLYFPQFKYPTRPHPPSTHIDKPHDPNHKSQSDDKFTITNHNTLKDKLSNLPTPTPADKVKTGANINKVTIKLSNYSSKRISQSDKVLKTERLSFHFQSSNKRERETERSKRENPLTRICKKDKKRVREK